MSIDAEQYLESIKSVSPLEGIPPLLEALWHEARGDWEAAHEIAQDIETPLGALVHAYLHRKEGDLSNARYWYSIAKAKSSTQSTDEEWRELVDRLLREERS